MSSKSAKEQVWQKEWSDLSKARVSARKYTTKGTATSCGRLSRLWWLWCWCVCVCAVRLLFVPALGHFKIQTEYKKRQLCHFGLFGSLRADAPLLTLEEFHFV